MEAAARSKWIEKGPAERTFSIRGLGTDQDLGGNDCAEDETRELGAMKLLEFVTEADLDKRLDIDIGVEQVHPTQLASRTGAKWSTNPPRPINRPRPRSTSA